MSVVNLNRVCLTGRLTRDPRLETLPSGLPVCEIELEVHRRWQDRETGAWGERIVLLDVVAFGTLAEAIARYLYAGREIGVDGWLDVRTREGGHDRQVRVMIDTMQFIGAPPELARESSRVDRTEVGELVMS